MPRTTLEQAKLCPKCNLPGKEASRSPIVDNPRVQRGTTLIVATCMNSVCPWYETDWFIQVNPDGSVPIEDYSKSQPKSFPELGASDKYLIQNVREAMAEQSRIEQERGGGEIRGRW